MTSKEFQAIYGNKATSDEPLSAEQYQQKHVKKPRAKAVKWTMPKQSESQQQAESVSWFRQRYPEFGKLLFSVPNGGFRNIKTAVTLKREGALAGVPDLFLALPRNGCPGLFIEQKIKGNKPSELQLQMMSVLSETGYKCEVVYSVDEFKSIIENYLNAA